MICNSSLLLLRQFFRWDWWNRWNSAGFVAAMWNRRVELMGPAFTGLRENFLRVPPVPPPSPTKIDKNACNAAGSTGSTWARRLPSRKNENVSFTQYGNP
jgi:hypothetical protein